MHFKESPFLKINTLVPDIVQRNLPGGVQHFASRTALQPHGTRMTERLAYWAEQVPGQVFLAQKDKQGHWQTLSYAQAWTKVQAISQFLLDSPLDTAHPLLILASNSIAHGLMALGALHVGIPYSPLGMGYATKGGDFGKLRHCVEVLTPGLVFVENARECAAALEAIGGHIQVVALEEVLDGQFAFSDVCNTPVGGAVAEAHAKIQADTVAKIMFTSGSTGLPKGVINTHGNICANWQQITQTFPLMENGGLTLMDWLPWNHTFGGNHNFGLTLFNGGSLYIDDGNPTPKGIEKTVANLRHIVPTVYFNVPKGFEELIPHLEADAALRSHFFSRLQLFFYAGASMPQHVWDALERLAFEATGKRLLIATGLGMTEASPSALFNTASGSSAGRLGVPVPGLEVKLVPSEDKWEARFKGPNITPGYWRNPEATVAAFDEEGFYKTGDALKMADENDPNEGLVFDGRIAEDFKLATGTWVNVGVLRARLIAASNGLLQDAVLTGRDRDYVGAIVFPEYGFCSQLTGLPLTASAAEFASHPTLRHALGVALQLLESQQTGSSTYVKKAMIADFNLSYELGEITDKGSVNQRAVLRNHPEAEQVLYGLPEAEVVIHAQFI